MATKLPPGYPFPDDEIVWSSHLSDFDPDAHSYIAVARLPEDHVTEINGKRHENSHRLVIHSPVRGPICLLTNSDDAVSLLSACFVLLSEDPGKHGGEGVASAHVPFFERKTGVEIDFSQEEDHAR